MFITLCSNLSRDRRLIVYSDDPSRVFNVSTGISAKTIDLSTVRNNALAYDFQHYLTNV